VTVKLENYSSHIAKMHPKEEVRLTENEKELVRSEKKRRAPTIRWGRAMIAVVIAILIVGSAAYYFTLPQSSPKIQVSPTSWDFGNISYQTVSHGFTIENVGSAPLKIHNVETSCPCTTAIVTVRGVSSPIFGREEAAGWSTTLQPGESGTIEVFYDPSYNPDFGHVSRAVRIESNDPSHSTFSIRITANVGS